MTENVQQTVYQREAPEIEAFKLGRMQDALRYVQELQRQGILPPTQAIAGFTSEQEAAGDLIREGVGSYAPFLQGGLDANQAAQQMISDTAMPFIQESYGQQLEGIADLGQARDLALSQMAESSEYRDAAMQGLSDASAGIGQAREGVGQQVSAAQQGLGRADQLGQQAARLGQQGLTDAARSSVPMTERAQAEAIRSGRQASQISGAGMQGIQDAAGGIAGQIGGAQRGLGQATRRARAGTQRAIDQFEGSAEQFDPSGIGAFMDPFTREVIEAEQAEIARLGEKQKMDARAQQAKAGAFGGSRGAIAEAEIGRNVLEQQARTGAQLRSQGFQQAAQQAQQAFEASKQRQQAGAGAIGQLGLSAEQLAQRGAGQAGQLGLQGQMSQAQLAENAAKLGISTEQLQAQLAAQAAQTGQNQAKLGMDAAQQGAQLGLSAAGLGQRGAMAGGQLGLQGQDAMARMSGQQANIATQGGQLGVQYGQLGQAGVGQLADMAQTRSAMGQGIGALADRTGNLASRLADMGGQQVAMGAQGQAMRQSDINNLLRFGGMGQQQAQNVLNATFAADQAAYQAPFQQMAFLSDMASGLPSSQFSITQAQSPTPGLGQQVAGLGVGIGATGRAMGMF